MYRANQATTDQRIERSTTQMNEHFEKEHSKGISLDAETVLRFGNYLLAAVALALVSQLLAAAPAFAQDVPDTCSAGGAGSGAQAVLDAINRVVVFGALAVGGLGAVGFLAAGAAKMIGSVSESMQYIGNKGVGGVLIGIAVGLGGTIIVRVMQWIVCNAG